MCSVATKMHKFFNEWKISFQGKIVKKKLSETTHEQANKLEPTEYSNCSH